MRNPVWTNTICRDHLADHAEIHTPTLGVEELVIGGYLDLRSDARTRTHHLVFSPSEGEQAILDYSSPEDGQH